MTGFIRAGAAFALAMATTAHAAEQYMPGQNEFGTMLVEDLWPADGDHDFNDAVIRYHYHFHLEGSLVSSITLTLDVAALGASFDAGLALRLRDLSQSGVHVARLTGTPGSPGVPAGPPVTLPLEPGEPDTVVRITSDLRADAFPGAPTGFLNTEPTSPVVEGVPIKVVITFDTPLTQCNASVVGDCGTTKIDLARAPFDLFLFRPGDFGHQIHWSRHPGTSQFDHDLWGEGIDGSDATCPAQTPGSRCFVDDTGIPSFLVIGEGVTNGYDDVAQYPEERVEISLGMPQITTFAATGGVSATSFYLPANTVSSYLFTEGSDSQPPPSPDFLPYCGDGAIDAGETCDDGAENGGSTCTTTCELPFVKRLAVGELHTCMLTDTGVVSCFGNSADNKLNVPPSLGTVIDLDAASYTTCALDTTGLVACWGKNDFNLLTVPSGLGNVVALEGGTYLMCAINDAGTAKCWGMNGDGQANIAPSTVWQDVAPGYVHSCGLTAANAVTCWGRNDWLQLNVPGGLTDAFAIDAGGDHTCAARGATGTVTCWGRTESGQSTPPGGLSDVVDLELGYGHSCALRSNGTVACWGSNSHGQRTVPGGLVDIVEIATRYYHTCALTGVGALHCWGRNDYGQAPP